jgi:outer membrane receptor protein involved in Fe transport
VSVPATCCARRFLRLLALAISALCGHVAHSATYDHLTLEQAFEQLEQQGLKILYSSDLVKPWMRVKGEPVGAAPRAVLLELIAPFSISAVDGPNGIVLLTRAKRSRAFASRVPEDRVPVLEGSADLAEIIVSASRYHLLQVPAPGMTVFEHDALEMIPTLSDDPLRALSHLPGVTRDDFSAKVNVRGGGTEETLVRFDGIRLYNPFHLKDFQSLFSAIDPLSVREIDFYTGGFPVAYGGRMSAVIDILPRASGALPHHALSVSTLSASALTSGQLNDGRTDWLVSGRRGNLDVLMNLADRNDSRPSYLDVYARLGHQISDGWSISGNLLAMEDDLLFYDSDEAERAKAEYRDHYVWLRLDHERENLSANVIVTRTQLESRRDGIADQELLAHGVLRDVRSHEIDSLQANGSWRINDAVLVHAGAEWSSSTGHYDYSDAVQFDVLFDVPGTPDQFERNRSLQARLRGEQYGSYGNVRVQLPFDTVLETGLRWDKETLSPKHQQSFSPRVSLVHELNDRMRLRAGWGRFQQSQTINELQISDGVVQFWPEQRAYHWLGGFDYRHPMGFELRVEGYRKQYRGLHPRFENLMNTFIVLPELKPDRLRIDASSATAKGIELSLRRMGDHAFRWWFGYSYASIKEDQDATQSYRSWDQEHTLTVGAGWRNDRWDLSIASSYHTGRPTTRIELGDDGSHVRLTEPRGSSRLNSYSSVDARVAHKWRFGDVSALTVFLELSNLLDRTNTCCVEYEIEVDEEGGRVLEIEDVDTLPLLPSLGFSVEF